MCPDYVAHSTSAAVASQFGPVSRGARGRPLEVMAEVTATIRKAPVPSTKGRSVSLAASIWILTALDPSKQPKMLIRTASKAMEPPLT
jgi:hypothetical protein